MSDSPNFIELGQRIREMRGKQSRQEFAENFLIAPSSLARWEAGDTQPELGFLVRLVGAFGCSLKWLITGDDDFPKNGKILADQQLEYLDKMGWGKNAPGIIMIPMVDAVLSAGEGSFETSGDSERQFAFRQDFLSPKGNISQMVLMRVDGDSMEPRISDGDMVLIDQSQKHLRTGKIFAVGVEDMVYLKMVSAMPGKVILSSINEDYPPLEVDTRGDLEDSVRIIGRMIWSCREW